MCSVCGCAEGETRIEGVAHHHQASDHHHHHHEHSHDPVFVPVVAGQAHLHYGQGAARAHAPGLTQQRMVQIEQDILSKNDRYARQNREVFAQRCLFTLNLVSSPGSGKTTLLTRTLQELKARFPVAVIEGDQQTSNDAERIRQTGVQAVQINTGKGCHLDAHMVGHALEQLEDLRGGLLFIENVGNLVCPAAFDLGEAHKVAILSVTEGEDKPIKYPDMFHAADLLLLNKVDLLPYLHFDVAACIDYARRVKPDIQVIQVSAQTGEGMQEWLEWLLAGRSRLINQRLQELEQQAQALKALL